MIGIRSSLDISHYSFMIEWIEGVIVWIFGGVACRGVWRRDGGQDICGLRGSEELISVSLGMVPRR
jgi:hypothetical protein